MLQTINYIFTRLFDYILYPFSFIADFWGLLFLSVLMSFVVLYIYKWVSSPKAIKNAKNQIKASILAIRLYKDLWKVIVISFFKSLFYTFKYFILNFGPVLLIIPILFPAFIQMDMRYGHEPFKIGDEMVIKAKFDYGVDGSTVELEKNEHFTPKMNPFFIKTSEMNVFQYIFRKVSQKNPLFMKVIQEANWKVETLKAGTTSIRIKAGDKIYEKRLIIGESRGAIAVSNKKMQKSSWEHFIYPVEKLLPESGDMISIYIDYPSKETSFLGITLHWLWFNLILVVVVVVALKNRFGIEF